MINVATCGETFIPTHGYSKKFLVKEFYSEEYFCMSLIRWPSTVDHSYAWFSY